MVLNGETLRVIDLPTDDWFESRELELPCRRGMNELLLVYEPAGQHGVGAIFAWLHVCDPETP